MSSTTDATATEKPVRRPKTIDMNRDVYTTGQIAKICNVAPRTVSKWIDSGLIKGYRIPGSEDRRVRRTVLIEFLESHDMMPEYPVCYGSFGLTPEAFALACDKGIDEFRTALEIPLSLHLTDILLGPTEGIEVARQVKAYCDQHNINVTWIMGDDGFKPDWVEAALTVEEFRRYKIATA